MTPPRSPVADDTPSALAGLRVLDLSTLFSAPQVSAMLGDLGADVVKIEPPGGDPLRRIGVARGGRSISWAVVSRNKRSVVLDLDTEVEIAPDPRDREQSPHSNGLFDRILPIGHSENPA